MAENTCCAAHLCFAHRQLPAHMSDVRPFKHPNFALHPAVTKVVFPPIRQTHDIVKMFGFYLSCPHYWWITPHFQWITQYQKMLQQCIKTGQSQHIVCPVFASRLFCKGASFSEIFQAQPLRIKGVPCNCGQKKQTPLRASVYIACFATEYQYTPQKRTRFPTYKQSCATCCPC